jgi:hypothetical protein
MIWGILGIVILLGIAFILFTPFYFEIDTDRRLVMGRFYQILYLTLLNIDNRLVLRLRIGPWYSQYNLPTQQLKKNKTQIKYKQNKRSRLSFYKARRIFNSFTIIKFKLHFDLANNEWNGIVFPLCFWVAHYYHLDIRVNFKHENVFQIQLKNNMAQLLWAYLFK